MKLVVGKAGPGVQAGSVSSSCPAGMQTTLAPARRHPGNGKLAALQVPGRPGAGSCCPSPTREQSALLHWGEHSSKAKALRWWPSGCFPQRGARTSWDTGTVRAYQGVHTQLHARNPLWGQRRSVTTGAKSSAQLAPASIASPSPSCSGN